jgi:hypothetical protein
MAGKTFLGTYVNGIVLSNPGQQNPATIAAPAYVTNNRAAHYGTAIYGAGAAAWTVRNLGRILGNGGASNGIELAAGGAVINGASGSPTGLIIASYNGIAIKGAAGTVVNFGAIIGVGAFAGRGVDLAAGGRVDNGGTAGGALIEGTTDGVRVGGGAGTVVNHGTIVALAGQGVYLGGGGSIGNFGTIQGGSSGILARAQPAAVVNFGTVAGTSTDGAGIYLTNGGVIGNETGGRVTARGNAIAIAGAVGSILNFGTVASTSKDSGAGIYLKHGGLIGNEASGRITAAGLHAVVVEGSVGTVVNYGTIVGAVQGSGSAVLLGHGGLVNNAGERAQISGRENGVAVAGGRGTVTNFGTIESTATVVTHGSVFGAAVLLAAGGALTNGAAAKTGFSRALISANEFGVYIGSASKPGTSGRVVNFGTIRSVGPGTIGSVAVVLAAGGTVVNRGLIAGATQSAIAIRGAPGAVTNSGTILSNSPGPLGAANGNGVFLQAGGAVTNAKHGLIATVRNDAIYARAGAATVTNFGTIVGANETTAAAVHLASGGTVVNGASGASDALVVGRRVGVEIEGPAETVVNFGTIGSTSTTPSRGAPQPAGVLMVGSGFVQNGAKGSADALITAIGDGVYIGGIVGIHTRGAVGTVVNYGTIQSTGTGALGSNAVHLAAGGRVTNRGLIKSAAQSGIVVRYSRGTVTNFGSIVSNATGTSGVGIYLRDGGLVTNQAAGAIIADRNDGIFVKSKPATIVNLGNIAGGSARAGAAVYLRAGGNLTNGTSGKTLGLISGRRDGVVLANGAGTVANFGTIESASTVLVSGSIQGVGVLLAKGGALRNGAAGASTALISAYGVGVYVAGAATPGAAAVVNYGTIQSVGVKVGPSSGVEIAGSGMVTNRGLIKSASASAVQFDDKAGLVTNFGSIVGTAGGTAGAGVYLANGGNVVNKAGGVIAGASDAGIVVLGAPGIVANAGIVRSRSGDGVYLGGGGDIANQKGASISGGAYGVYLYHPGGTVTNRGTITGGDTGLAASGAGHATVINFGTIASADGTGGTAVAFDDNVGDAVLVVEPGAVFIGAILGGGDGEIRFAGGGTTPIGGVSGFSTVVLGNGVGHALTLTAANFTGVGAAAITVIDGNSGNTVTAATLPTADRIVVHAGIGADAVTGGAGDDRIFAGGKTVMTGGAGANEFVFSAPGANRITDFAAATNAIALSNAGFDLGLPGASSTPHALPAALFTENAAGAFAKPTQRFAYDTTDGKLFYSATGTTANEKLVVTLTGAPDPAGRLFFVA